jgi:hypothetical protein
MKSIWRLFDSGVALDSEILITGSPQGAPQAGGSPEQANFGREHFGGNR